MRSLVREKQRAVELRKKGYSYRDILKEVNVSKSSISLWLQKLPLTDIEKKYLKSRHDSNISLGRIRAATANRSNRLQRDKELFGEARDEFQKFSADPFFHVGIALYWAEGAKRDSTFAFVNSDEEMMMVMVMWIEKFLKISREVFSTRLYIHKPYAHERCEEFWSKKTGIPIRNFRKTVYKPTGIGVKKRPDYKGCLRLMAGGMTALRRLSFWQHMLVEYYRKK